LDLTTGLICWLELSRASRIASFSLGTPPEKELKAMEELVLVFFFVVLTGIP